MKKIAILIDNMSVMGGSQRISLDLYNELSKYYDSYFITWYKETFVYDADEINKDKIIFLKAKKKRLRYDIFSLFYSLVKIISSKKIEILIVVGRYSALLLLFIKVFVKVKIIFWEQTSISGYLKVFNTPKRKMVNKLILLIYKKVGDKIVFLTTKDEKIFIKENKVYNTIHIYNYVNNRLLLNSLSYDITSKKIITVGRLDYAKGYEYLIQIAKLVFQRHPDWEWHIYGDGETKYKNKIIDLINKSNLKKHIVLQGNSSNIYNLYHDYSFYVMTSRYEGFGLVLIEAKSQKLPLISFDIKSGPSDIIRDGIDGFLIKPFDCNAMVEKICKLIENPQLRQQLSDNAQANLDKFCKEKIIKEWCNIIEDDALK